MQLACLVTDIMQALSLSTAQTYLMASAKQFDGTLSNCLASSSSLAETGWAELSHVVLLQQLNACL